MEQNNGTAGGSAGSAERAQELASRSRVAVTAVWLLLAHVSFCAPLLAKDVRGFAFLFF